MNSHISPVYRTYNWGSKYRRLVPKKQISTWRWYIHFSGSSVFWMKGSYISVLSNITCTWCITIFLFYTLLLSTEPLLLIMTVHKEYSSQKAKPKVNPHHCSHLWIGVEETHDYSFPSFGSRQVEEQEQDHLNDQSEEEYRVGYFKHTNLIIISHIINFISQQFNKLKKEFMKNDFVQLHDST